MNNHKVLALGLLLSMSLVGGLVADAAKQDTKKSTTVKADVKTAIDTEGSIKGDLNICYIDLFGAMGGSAEGKEASKQLELKREELAKLVEPSRAKYETAATEYKNKAATMNESARAKKEQEIIKAERDYKNALQDAEEQMKLVMQTVTEALAKEVELAVAELAKKDGLDAVVDKMTGRVLYTSGKADYTAKVVQSMDKHYTYKVAHNEKSAASNVTLASNSNAKKATTAA